MTGQPPPVQEGHGIHRDAETCKAAQDSTRIFEFNDLEPICCALLIQHLCSELMTFVDHGKAQIF